MIENHFTIIVPAFNCKNYYKQNISSIFLQDYNNFSVIYTDDKSTDDSLEIVEDFFYKCATKSKKNIFYKFIKNEKNIGALENIYNMIHLHCNVTDTIIITLDGDDWLNGKDTLKKINEIYNKTNCFITSGDFVSTDPSYQKNNYKELFDKLYNFDNLRQYPWFLTHLRTFKRELFLKIRKEDLLNEDGNFYETTWDLAMMFPMAEMSGKDRIFVSDNIFYVYNRHNPISDDKIKREKQFYYENKIRNKEKYARI